MIGDFGRHILTHADSLLVNRPVTIRLFQISRFTVSNGNLSFPINKTRPAKTMDLVLLIAAQNARLGGIMLSLVKIPSRVKTYLSREILVGAFCSWVLQKSFRECKLNIRGA